MRARGRDFGDLQIEILDVLWKADELSAAAVRDQVARRRDVALTTVATVLQRMDKAGLVAHRADGRQHLFRAAVTRHQARHDGVRALVRRLFGGDPAALVSHLVETETDRLSDADRERIRALLLPSRRPRNDGPRR